MRNERAGGPKFPMGQVVITTNAANQLDQAEVVAAIRRHVAADWGEVDDEDRAENELSLQQGFRLMSVYTASDGTRFWIITEADRSATTVLLPEDY